MLYPQFCPNPECKYHHRAPELTRWYYRSGTYSTNVSGTVTRFVCRACGKHFSEQTFSLDYYVKKKVPYATVMQQVNNCGGIRALSRNLGVSPQVILNRVSRLARQSIAVQATLLSEFQLSEDLVTDGFESFVADQYQPNNIHLLVGSRSQMLYSFDYAHIRRKGRMTELQKQERTRREANYLHTRTSISESFSHIIDTVEQLIKNRSTSHTTLYSDEKKEYKGVIRKASLLKHLKQKGSFRHITISSKAPRTTNNKLFPVNYMDRLLRKDMAVHVRETVRFSQNANNSLERLALFQVQHNCIKPYRIAVKDKKDYLHAEVAGVTPEKIAKALRGFFSLRKFVSHVDLNQSQNLVWFRGIPTLSCDDAVYLPKFVWM